MDIVPSRHIRHSLSPQAVYPYTCPPAFARAVFDERPTNTAHRIASSSNPILNPPSPRHFIPSHFIHHTSSFPFISSRRCMSPRRGLSPRAVPPYKCAPLLVRAVFDARPSRLISSQWPITPALLPYLWAPAPARAVFNVGPVNTAHFSSSHSIPFDPILVHAGASHTWALLCQCHNPAGCWESSCSAEAQHLLNSCAAAAQQLHSSCQAAAQQLLSCWTAAQQQPSSCSAAIQQLLSSCSAAAQQLLSSCSADAQQLLRSCSATARQLLSKFPAAAQHMLSTFLANAQQVLRRCSQDAQQTLSRCSADALRLLQVICVCETRQKSSRINGRQPL